MIKPFEVLIPRRLCWLDMSSQILRIFDWISCFPSPVPITLPVTRVQNRRPSDEKRGKHVEQHLNFHYIVLYKLLHLVVLGSQTVMSATMRLDYGNRGNNSQAIPEMFSTRPLTEYLLHFLDHGIWQVFTSRTFHWGQAEDKFIMNQDISAEERSPSKYKASKDPWNQCSQKRGTNLLLVVVTGKPPGGNATRHVFNWVQRAPHPYSTQWQTQRAYLHVLNHLQSPWKTTLPYLDGTFWSRRYYTSPKSHRQGPTSRSQNRYQLMRCFVLQALACCSPEYLPFTGNLI
jgi:hypothetical protein